jgi:8-oxo-dGTP diphosphatase
MQTELLEPPVNTPQKPKAAPASEPDYVVGFLFRNGGDEVALIRKNKPAFQKGLLNGVGGKIEFDEHPLTAMIREFEEEAGPYVINWRCFAVMTLKGGNQVYFYTSHEIVEIETKTAEEVSWYPVAHLRQYGILPNLSWLVPLALDKDSVTAEVSDLS